MMQATQLRVSFYFHLDRGNVTKYGNLLGMQEYMYASAWFVLPGGGNIVLNLCQRLLIWKLHIDSFTYVNEFY
jgi:hypothetical protein